MNIGFIGLGTMGGPMAALTRERYSQARAQGWGDQDCTAIVNLVRDLGRLA